MHDQEHRAEIWSYSFTRDFWPNPHGREPPKELELKFLQHKKVGEGRMTICKGQISRGNKQWKYIKETDAT